MLPTTFSILITIAALASAFVLGRELERKRLAPASFAALLLGPTALAAFLGAKLLGLTDARIADGSAALEYLTSGSGHSFYGLLAFGLLALVLQVRRARIPLLPFADALAPALMLGYAIGRIGCHLAGDGCYGSPSGLPWAVAYPSGVVPTLERVHPTPLYESAVALIGFALLWKLRRSGLRPGSLFALALLAHAGARFLVEFLRLNPRHGPFSQAQWISLALILSIGLAALWRVRRPMLPLAARTGALLVVLALVSSCAQPPERIALQGGRGVRCSATGFELEAAELILEGRTARATELVVRPSAGGPPLREVVVALFLDDDGDGRFDPPAEVGVTQVVEIDPQGIARLSTWSADLSGPDAACRFEVLVRSARERWVVRVGE